MADVARRTQEGMINLCVIGNTPWYLERDLVGGMKYQFDFTAFIPAPPPLPVFDPPTFCPP